MTMTVTTDKTDTGRESNIAKNSYRLSVISYRLSVNKRLQIIDYRIRNKTPDGRAGVFCCTNF